MSDEQRIETSKSTVYMPGTWVQLDAKGTHYKDLNRQIRSLVLDGARNLEVRSVYGQRYIGTNLFGTRREGVRINIYGTPGSDLGAFMDGPIIEVFGNVQDATGNTMNSGRIVVHGSAGDVLGYGMRGGEIYIRGNVGYRVGIHMKEYADKIPTVVIGGTVQDFFGEYMAGGRIIVLNQFFEDNPPTRQSYFIGTGMHGGVIYIHGDVDLQQIGYEVAIATPDEDEIDFIAEKVRQFSRIFGLPDASDRLKDVPFIKLYPKSARPYEMLYAY
jgi:glutamate synthase domain-containing protein 3